MKRIIILLLANLVVGLPVWSVPHTMVTYTIDAERNAYDHNNKGIMYMEEKFYAAAIQEFKIAISLNPNTQATAVYFTNLGNVYTRIGYPNLALDCFERALKQYNLNFDYYINLAKCYKTLNMATSKLGQYSKRNDQLSKVMVGLLYEQLGNKKKAIIVLDEFAMTEPELIITPSVKQHIQKLVKELQK